MHNSLSIEWSTIWLDWIPTWLGVVSLKMMIGHEFRNSVLVLVNWIFREKLTSQCRCRYYSFIW